MKKRWIKPLLAILCIFCFFYGIDCYLSSMRPVPDSELICETTSPNGTYTVRAYLASPVLSSDSVWCEYDANNVLGWSRVFYKEYRMDYVDIKWEDDNTVIINGRTLNLPFDIYKWKAH